MSAVLHTYRYAATSRIVPGQRPRLLLATSSEGSALSVHFFEGRARNPRLLAELLTTVHLVVGSRFFTPANTVARNLALADPVVTSGDGLLRFEGFSSCCSTYVRVDLLPEGYEGEIVGRGTTNVDFNAGMRAALAGIDDAAGLALSVGQQELRLRSGDLEIVERKVELPLRWLRGMLEVQSYLASMHRRFDVSANQALRFLRGLPKASTSRTPLWMAPGPAGLFMSTQPVARGVRVTETRRLRLLEFLLPKADSVAVYADEAQQAVAWLLDFGGARLTLALSAEVWRGFSGEGQALRALMQCDGDSEIAGLSRLRAHLRWQSSLDARTLAHTLDLAPPAIDNALRVLGVSGLVGFDLHQGSYFHRVLPFDLSLAEGMHPRLAAARELLATGAVAMLRRQPLEATVRSGEIEHRVREVDGVLRCTCPWFAKHPGTRGPCKHVLAVEAWQPDPVQGF